MGAIAERASGCEAGLVYVYAAWDVVRGGEREGEKREWPSGVPYDVMRMRDVCCTSRRDHANINVAVATCVYLLFVDCFAAYRCREGEDASRL